MFCTQLELEEASPGLRRTPHGRVEGTLGARRCPGCGGAEMTERRANCLGLRISHTCLLTHLAAEAGPWARPRSPGEVPSCQAEFSPGEPNLGTWCQARKGARSPASQECPSGLTKAVPEEVTALIGPNLEHTELSSAGEQTCTQRLGHLPPQPFAKPPPGPGTQREVDNICVNGREQHPCASAKPKSTELPLLGRGCLQVFS